MVDNAQFAFTVDCIRWIDNLFTKMQYPNCKYSLLRFFFVFFLLTVSCHVVSCYEIVFAKCHCKRFALRKWYELRIYVRMSIFDRYACVKTFEIFEIVRKAFDFALNVFFCVRTCELCAVSSIGNWNFCFGGCSVISNCRFRWRAKCRHQKCSVFHNFLLFFV